MAEQMRQGFCQECNKYTLVKRKGVNHILHLLLSLFTIGAWIFVWIALALFKVGGWRCQTCGSDRITDTGEMLSVRGWVLVVIGFTFVLPLVVISAGGSNANTVLDTLAPFIGLVPLVALPVMGVIAYQQRKRKKERLQTTRVEVPQPVKAEPVSRQPEAESESDAGVAQTPAGMTVSEEFIERAEPDTDAAADFRRRMRQQN